MEAAPHGSGARALGRRCRIAPGALALAACPILLLTADPDEGLVTPEDVQAMSALWRDGRVVQIEGAGLPTAFPPLRASESVHTNLPHATTSFVGRTEELERIDRLVNREGYTLKGAKAALRETPGPQAAAQELPRPLAA